MLSHATLVDHLELYIETAYELSGFLTSLQMTSAPAETKRSGGLALVQTCYLVVGKYVSGDHKNTAKFRAIVDTDGRVHEFGWC